MIFLLPRRCHMERGNDRGASRRNERAGVATFADGVRALGSLVVDDHEASS